MRLCNSPLAWPHLPRHKGEMQIPLPSVPGPFPGRKHPNYPSQGAGEGQGTAPALLLLAGASTGVQRGVGARTGLALSPCVRAARGNPLLAGAETSTASCTAQRPLPVSPKRWPGRSSTELGPVGPTCCPGPLPKTATHSARHGCLLRGAGRARVSHSPERTGAGQAGQAGLALQWGGQRLAQRAEKPLPAWPARTPCTAPRALCHGAVSPSPRPAGKPGAGRRQQGEAGAWHSVTAYSFRGFQAQSSLLALGSLVCFLAKRQLSLTQNWKGNPPGQRGWRSRRGGRSPGHAAPQPAHTAATLGWARGGWG